MRTLTLLFALSACTPEGRVGPQVVPVPVAAPAPPPPPAPAPVAAEVTVERVEATLPHPRAEIETSHDVYRSGTVELQEALDAINSILGADARKAAEGMRAFVDSGDATAPEGASFYLDRSCSTASATPRLVSVLCATSTFEGGAHPNLSFEALNFAIDGPSVRRLDLTGAVPGAGARDELARFAADALRARGASFVEGSALTAEQLQVFTLSPEGLLLHFAPYVVGSYAEGPYDLLIVPEQARAWLAPDLARAAGL